jgi:hypothetical protein
MGKSSPSVVQRMENNENDPFHTRMPSKRMESLKKKIKQKTGEDITKDMSSESFSDKKLTMTSGNTKKHSKANVPTALKQTIEDWIEKEGKYLGYGNFDQFLRDAAREKYLELIKQKTQEVKVVENFSFSDAKGEIWKLKVVDGNMFCQVCSSPKCNHIKRLKKDKQVQETIKNLIPEFSGF